MIGFDPTSGTIYTTEFTAYSPDESLIISWGDGSYSYGPTATHIYTEPDDYTITIADSLSSYSQSSVCVSDFLDVIDLELSSELITAGCEATLTVSLTSKNQINEIEFYSNDSSSDPWQQPQNFWSHLKPQWRFYHDDEVVSAITITGDAVSSEAFTYYTASAELVYVDDMTGTPTLFATVKKDRGVNSRMIDLETTTVTAYPSTKLNITQDGISDISPIQWAGKPIYFVVSLGNDEGCSLINHYSTHDGTYNVSLSGVCKLSTGSDEMSSIDIPLKDEDCFSVGGYFFGSVTIPESELSVFIEGNIKDPCEEYKFVKERSLLKDATISIILQDYTDNISLITSDISGTSAPFDVYPFEDFSRYIITNSNTSVFDDAILKYTPETFKNSVLIDDYMRAVFDKNSATKQIFEKIANFSLKANLDTCDIRHLVAQCDMHGVAVDDFSVIMPQEIRDVVDLYSMKTNKVFGHKCGCNMEFIFVDDTSIKCDLCKKNKKTNIGDFLVNSDIIEYGDALLIKSNSAKYFELMYVPDLGGVNITVKELKEQWDYLQDKTEICMYKWVDSSQDNTLNSLIDYDNEDNYLTFDALDKWDEIVTEKLNFILTKNLRG